MDEKKYCYCKVKIEGRRNSLYYLSEITDLKAEDTVEVPFGYENELMIGTVVSIEYYTKYEAPYPVENTKKIIGKVSSSNSDSDICTDETGTILIKYVGEKKKLISFKVPDGIIEISPKAFANAHSLSKIELPEGLKIIGDEAFKSTSIEKVKIPSTVEEIGKLAFPAYSYKHIRFDKNNRRFKTDSDCIYRINDDGTYIVIACWKTRLGKYKLDDNVKAIADNAFYNCTGLKEIVLNDKLEVIGNDVFCKNTITSIKLPENVKEINNLPLLEYEGKDYEEKKIDIEISPNNKHYTMEDKTLYKVLEDGTLELLLCSSKKDKIIVKDGTKIIKKSSFKNKKNIKTILLPESLELIEEFAFSGCNKLKTVTINNDKFGELENVIYLPSKIKEIKEFTFNLCGFTTIKFSDNIENIEKNTFLCCDRLIKMILPKNLKTFNNMFEDYYISNNLELIEVPKENELFCSVDGIVFDKNKETIIYVPDAYKCDCYEIPNTVKNIGKSFSYCKNIKKLVLNNQITNIEEKAFEKSSIEEFVIPNTLTHIGNKAFDLSYGIKSVKIYGDENSYIKTYLSKRTNTRIAFIFISQNTDLNTIELQTNYKYKVTPEGIIINKYLGKEKTVEVPDTIENKPVIEIGKEAFISNYELKKIAFPSSTKKIGNGAFKHCANLKEVIIPDSVEEIGEEAFYGQNKISKIVLPKNLKKISRSMLDYCNVLTEIKIPESVTEIEG